MRDRGREQRQRQPALARPYRAKEAHEGDRGDRREHEQSLGRRNEQAEVSFSPRAGEPAGGPGESLLEGRAEVGGVVRGHERHRGRRPEQEGRQLARPSQRDAEGQHDGQRHVGVAGGHRQGQREPGAARPDWVVFRPHHAEERQAEEPERRRVLPQRLARGPHAGAEREQERGHRGLVPGSAKADGHEEDAGGQPREQRRRHLAGDRAARLVEGEGRPRHREHGRGEQRRHGRVDGQVMLADRAREGRFDLGVLVEVEVALLHQAGRDVLVRARVAGADGPAVGEQQQRNGHSEQQALRRRRPLRRCRRVHLGLDRLRHADGHDHS
ncbi:MAG TPA: hypothetical protein VMT87_14995 [Vicinamibacteria bacterium]|nr:hypothetical protein [Vicinamibacteria bacterium]